MFTENEICAIFMALDKDGSKTIEINEFYKGFKQLFPSFSKQTIFSLFRMQDKDKSGTLDIDEFITLIRFIEKKAYSDDPFVVLFDKCDINGDGKLDIIEFATNARKESENNPLSVHSLGGLRESQIVFSCIPWADITMCSNERDYTDPKLKDDTAPILVWGKYTEQNGKYIVNMTLYVNHRFIDGYFVGQFVQKLEEKIAELK